MSHPLLSVFAGVILFICVSNNITLFSISSNQTNQGGVESQRKVSDYEVRASVLILGDMGAVGGMTIEESTTKEGNKLEKVLYLHGNTDPKQVNKGRDIGGEFRITKRFPLGPDGAVDQVAVASGQDVEDHYRGRLKRNEKVTGEEVVFFPDHIISTRENGKETRIQGKFGSPLSALEYLIDNDIKTGDVFESKFILNGYAYIFKCEVEKNEFLDPLGVSAFKVVISTYDWIRRNKYGKPIAIKKKGIRLWFCKDGAYKNMVVRMNIKYKWFLTLKIDLID